MIFDSHIERLEEIFLRQFDQSGDQVFYRKNGRGAPIPVSYDEREGFRLKYRSSCGRMIWAAVFITVAGITFRVLIAPGSVDEGPGIFVITLGVIGAIAVQSGRISSAPARALERRSPVGNELSRDEWQSRHFATTSWPLLCSIFIISTGIF
jgi:hypothetical protein